jgi:tetratricopeptide (TPR) repeat protein
MVELTPPLPKVVPKPVRRLTLLEKVLPAWQAPRGLSNRFILLIALSLGIGGGLYALRFHLAHWLLPPPPPLRVAPLSASAQAQQAYTKGLKAYGERRFTAAAACFEAALRLDPQMGEAHRSLGILYAHEHAAARAAWHYQRYLDLVPEASDAAAVRKFLADYVGQGE